MPLLAQPFWDQHAASPTLQSARRRAGHLSSKVNNWWLSRTDSIAQSLCNNLCGRGSSKLLPSSNTVIIEPPMQKRTSGCDVISAFGHYSMTILHGKNSCSLGSHSSGSWWAVTVATYCPGNMANHPKSKSTGGGYQADVSPCRQR